MSMRVDSHLEPSTDSVAAGFCRKAEEPLSTDELKRADAFYSSHATFTQALGAMAQVAKSWGCSDDMVVAILAAMTLVAKQEALEV